MPRHAPPLVALLVVGCATAFIGCSKSTPTQPSPQPSPPPTVPTLPVHEGFEGTEADIRTRWSWPRASQMGVGGLTWELDASDYAVGAQSIRVPLETGGWMCAQSTSVCWNGSSLSTVKPVDLTTVSSAQITFMNKRHAATLAGAPSCWQTITSENAVRFDVLWSSDGSTWNVLQSFTGEVPSWSLATVSLNAVAGLKVRIGFRVTAHCTQQGNTSAGWQLDDISMTAPTSAACVLNTSSLAFGTVTVGQSADRSFAITNTGGGTLSGTVTSSSALFTIVSGAPYSLTSGQTNTVTVRFTPTQNGSATVALNTGSACSSVTCSGFGQPSTPSCQVFPTSLSFGTVAVGQSADRSFAITNMGGGTLSGTVTSSSALFTIVRGATYSLTNGQMDTVTVRFAPTASGSKSCTVNLGNTGCAAVSCSGTGNTAMELNSGVIGNGGTYIHTFAGAGTYPYNCTIHGSGMAGTVIVATGQPATASVNIQNNFYNPATVSVAAGGTVTWTNNGSNHTVTSDSSTVTSCSVSPSSLDFGTVPADPMNGVNRTFDITNTGTTSLSGTVSSPCSDFTIVGPASYNLSPAQSATFTVRFAAATIGQRTCTLGTGAACAQLPCTATVVPNDAVCSVQPNGLSFLDVGIGDRQDATFTLTNTGTGPIAGTVSESCADFSIAGLASYNLGPGQDQTFIVRFEPSQTGYQTCTVQVGPGCSTVTCSGTGMHASTPVCGVSTTRIDMGSVYFGSYKDTTFTISNLGQSALNGTVAFFDNSPPFSLVGPTTYALGPGQSQVFTIRFSALNGTPGHTYSYGATLKTGTQCSAQGLDLTVTATAVEPPRPPACGVSPTSLDFGTVTVGQFKDLQFDLHNTGDGTLCGSVSESCPDFTASFASYCVTPPGFIRVTVRFSPTTTGFQQCTINPGTGCTLITATGTGN